MVPVTRDGWILIVKQTGTARATAEKLLPALSENLSTGILPPLVTLDPAVKHKVEEVKGSLRQLTLPTRKDQDSPK